MKCSSDVQTSDVQTKEQPKVLVARCRTRLNGVTTIHVLDISIAGCIFDKRMIMLEVGQRVLISLPTLAFMAAKVAWIEDGLAGLVFEQPLYRPVLDHLMRYFRTPVRG